MSGAKFFISTAFKFVKNLSEGSSTYSEITVLKRKIFNFLFLIKYFEGIRFDRLVDILVHDRLYFKNRFHVTYLLHSSVNNARCAVSTQTSEGSPLHSIINLFECASWIEREVWDMYGVYFFGNNDFRRLLCDYGFKGHPLRKDYPLSGYYEMLYDEQYTLVSYFPVEFVQEYRLYEIGAAWGLQEVI